MGHDRQAEVRHLDPAQLVDQDVLGLDVAVDHAALRRVLQSFCHLTADEKRLALLQPQHCLDALVEVLAGDVLHRQIVQLVLLADFIRLDDIRVIERQHHLGFAAETGHDSGIVGSTLVQDFQGDFATVRKSLGQVDTGHAAFAQRAQQPILADDIGLAVEPLLLTQQGDDLLLGYVAFLDQQFPQPRVNAVTAMPLLDLQAFFDLPGSGEAAFDGQGP